MRASAILLLAAPVAVLGNVMGDAFAPHANMRRLAFPQNEPGGNRNSSISTSTQPSTSLSVSTTDSTTSTGSSQTASTTQDTTTTDEPSSQSTTRRSSTFVTTIQPTREGEAPITLTSVVLADETGDVTSPTETGSGIDTSSTPSIQTGGVDASMSAASKWVVGLIAGVVAVAAAV